jgi:dihydrofolate reductase
VIFGGAAIAQTFMQLGLIDEYYLLVHPIVLGRGKPLFKGLHDQLNLKLLKTKVFGSGVVLLDYQSDRKEPKGQQVSDPPSKTAASRPGGDRS